MNRGLLFLLLPLLLLAGCWDRNEVNEMAIVIGTAIDYKDEETVELSVQLVIPKSMAMGSQSMGSDQGSPGMKSTLVESASGYTIYDAVAKIQERIPRRLFWGHNRILVISEEVAKDPFSHHVDFFLRHPQPRLRTKLFISEGQAKDMLAVMTPLENSSSKAAQELSRLGFGLRVTIMDFLQMINSDANSAAVPLLKVVPPDPEIGEELSEHLQISGAAVVKNGRMVGRIDDETVRGLMWILDQIDTAEISFEPDKAKGSMSVQIIRSKTRLVPKIENGKWRVIVSVDTYDDIVENQTNLDLDDPRVIDELEKNLEKVIADRIQRAIQQVQKEMKADCFGFANVFHRHFPEQWRQVKDRWETMFPDVEIELAISAKIKRYGLATHSQGTPKDEVEHR